MTTHRQITITNDELSQWATTRADDAGRLARELIQHRQHIVGLVVAAREFWDIHNDLSEESVALDRALEPFSGQIPYDEETPSPQPNVAVTEAVKRYLKAIDSDPENDIWDTWDGKPAEGALKTASDASWADHGQKIEARLSELRAALATTEGSDNG